MSFARAKAPGRGLRFRALGRTIADTADWLAARNNAAAWRNALSAANERAVPMAA